MADCSGHPDWPAQPDWDWLLSSKYVGALLIDVDQTVDEIAALTRGRLAYLATPYSKQVTNCAGRWCYGDSQYSVIHCTHWSAVFAMVGVTAISPILNSASIAHLKAPDNRTHDQGLNPLDATFWMNWCAPLLFNSQCVIIPPLEGWRESQGIWREVELTLKSHKKIYLVKSENEGSETCKCKPQTQAQT